MPAVFVFKKANTPTQFAEFPEKPSWGVLASKITNLFGIPSDFVGVAFIDETKKTFSLNGEEELQRFYEALEQHSEVIRFVVLDLRVPDTAIASTSLQDSNHDDALRLFCWVLSMSRTPFPVNMRQSETVGDLMVEIKKAVEPKLEYLGADDLIVWKLSSPIPSSQLDEKLEHIRSPKDITGCIKLDTMDRLWEHFSSPPYKHLHIIVQLPFTFQQIFKRARSEDTEPQTPKKIHTEPPLVPSIPMLRMASQPPVIQEHWTPRSATVHSLYQRLRELRLIQVRGTPGSGKTTLMELLHAHILLHDPEAIVEVIKGWRKEPGTQINDRIYQRIKTYPFAGPHNYLLFDNAQDSYWDESLWENFFKDTVQHGSGPFAILFCSYGSPSARPVDYDNGTPLFLYDSARISLISNRNGATNSENPPIGLLFSQEEFDEAVDRFKTPDLDFIHVDQELRQMLFEWTMGHAGAVGDLLFKLSRVERKKLREGGTLTVDNLLNMHPAGKLLSDLPNFSRGLPTANELQKAGIATVFQKLLTQGSIVASGNSDEDFCHRHGWMHSEQCSGKSCYTFPSPLHAMYVSWRLIPTVVQCPFMTVRDMTFSILKKFNPSQLSSPSRIGVAFSDRPLEARYQFELYRGLFAATGGGVRICPELLTAQGACKGHIDFFVPDKKWGIELTREGNGLSEHSSRFGLTSKYGVWLTSNDMMDYIILDCRTDTPKSANPHIQNLFHAVFKDQFHHLTILNNMLEEVEEPFALLER